MDETLVVDTLAKDEHAIEELRCNTSYSTKIVAKSKYLIVSWRIVRFKYVGNTPSSFAISYLEIACGVASIRWRTPTVENGTGYSYKIYINGEYKTSYGSYETERTGFNFSVAEGEEHIRMVIARSYNGAETAQELTSFQEACPIPSDFEITRSDTTGTQAYLTWNESTMSDDSRVYYLLTANEVSYPALFTFTHANGYVLTNLERNTDYTVVIRSESEENGKSVESTMMFAATNEYPPHPRICITDTTLYTQDSDYFAGQLTITFS